MERLSGADWVGKKAIEVNSANFSKSKTPLQKIRRIYLLLTAFRVGPRSDRSKQRSPQEKKLALSAQKYIVLNNPVKSLGIRGSWVGRSR